MTEPTPHHDGLTADELDAHADPRGVLPESQPTDWNLWFLGVATGGSLSLLLAGWGTASPALFSLGFLFTILTILVYKFRRNQ